MNHGNMSGCVCVLCFGQQATHRAAHDVPGKPLCRWLLYFAIATTELVSLAVVTLGLLGTLLAMLGNHTHTHIYIIYIHPLTASPL